MSRQVRDQEAGHPTVQIKKLSEPQLDPQDWNAGYGPGQEYFAYDGGSNTASSSHNPCLPLSQDPEAWPDPYDQSGNEWMPQFLNWQSRSSSPGGGNQLSPFGRAPQGESPPATPEFVREFQRYADQLFSGPDSAPPDFRSDNAPAGGLPIAAPDPNLAQITEGMDGMRRPFDSGGASPHSGVNARGKRRADSGEASAYVGKNAHGKRIAESQTPEGANPPPHQIQHSGSPGASGPSHLGAGQSVAQTSHPDPVAAAPIGYTLPVPVFPAVDSNDVPWALSDEPHPIFLPENLPLRPRYSYDLPQDALDNLRRAVAGSEGRAPQVSKLYGYSGGGVIETMRRNGMAQHSITGLTMIPLDPRPKGFGSNIKIHATLSKEDVALLKAQFGRGWTIIAIAAKFEINPKTVQRYKNAFDQENRAGQGSGG